MQPPSTTASPFKMPPPAAAGTSMLPAMAAVIDHAELTDIRAVQRTFDGAYTRTALGQLGYAILILRLFERDFYWCGLVYTALAVQLILVGVYRYNLALSNDDRWKDIQMTSTHHAETIEACSTNGQMPRQSAQDAAAVTSSDAPSRPTIIRPTFRTAGTIVAWATIGTLILQVALVVLVLRT